VLLNRLYNDMLDKKIIWEHILRFTRSSYDANQH